MLKLRRAEIAQPVASQADRSALSGTSFAPPGFGGFWKAKWSQIGTKIDQKSMPIAKCDFLKNRALAAAGARFLRFWGSKLGAKID